jgi:hypothetical protein
MPTPEQHDHAALAELSASLPVRTDAERVRCVLGDAFVEHADSLWPSGKDMGSPAWVRANVDSLLATVERLYAMALGGDHPGSAEFLDRMSWLPALARDLEHGAAQLDG